MWDCELALTFFFGFLGPYLVMFDSLRRGVMLSRSCYVRILSCPAFFFIFEFRFEVPRLFPRSCLVAHCTLPLVCEHVGKQKKKRENKDEWNSGRFLVCDFGFGCTPVEGFFFLLPFCLVGFWRSAVGYLILVCICTLLVFMLIDCMYIFCDFLVFDSFYEVYHIPFMQ